MAKEQNSRGRRTYLDDFYDEYETLCRKYGLIIGNRMDEEPEIEDASSDIELQEHFRRLRV